MRREKLNNILFVFILYKQRLDESKTFNTLIDKCVKGHKLFVFDNSPAAQHTQRDFEDEKFECCTIKYVSDTTNPGLSYGYNRAAEWAKECGCEWVMLLDQDSNFSTEIIEEFLTKKEGYPTIKLFAPTVMCGEKQFMSPVKINKLGITKCSENYKGLLPAAEFAPINSGIFINVEAFFKVGGYNEKVRLDYSDFEFMERFKKEYKTFYILDSIGYQSFSNLVENSKQKIERFALFCQSLKHCERHKISDHLKFMFIVLKRCINLVIRCRSSKPIVIFFKKYLKNE